MKKLKELRFKDIQELLKVNKRVYVTDLAQYFRVSSETIRRDLDELESMKLVSRFSWRRNSL